MSDQSTAPWKQGTRVTYRPRPDRSKSGVVVKCVPAGGGTWDVDVFTVDGSTVRVPAADLYEPRRD